MIELTVKTLDSRNHAFSVPDNYTVRQFKEHIADSVSISADSQRLIYCGRVLQDDKSLTEYDVNGKVIHLVQRAPPVNNGSGPDRGSTSARTNSSPPGARRGTSLLHRGTFIGSTGNTGNAMYLGAMAFPAEIMEAHGISMQNPRHCLSQSRLAVVRSMLRRASIILNRLENPPQESADTSPENGTCPPETSAEEETAAGATTPIAAIEISPQLIINGQQIDVGGPSIDIQAEAVPEQTTSASGGNGDPQTASTSEEQPPQNETEEEGGNAGSRYPRTRGLADLMDQASEINTRVQPFMAQYQQLMRDDPVFSDQEAVVTNQRLFTSVSEIMHNLAHAYHALSDIMCDLAQPPPRFLRCRPVLIHHSAVVQTGFPIQVSASLATGSNNGQSSNSGGTRATDGGARATAGPSEQPEPQGPVTGAAEATAQPVTGPTAAANPPTITRTPGEDASGQTQTPSSQRTTRIGQSAAGGPGFEIFVDVAPGSITIDSVEATVLTNSNPNISEPTWQNPPEFVQNLISALAGQFMGATLQQYRFPEQPGSSTATSSTAASSTAASNTATSTTAAASSQTTATTDPPPAAAATNTPNVQARVTTATHPTTATQTRSTARPHVHLSPSIHGLRNNTFDPFLPCNSHHIRSGVRLRRQGQGQGQEQSQGQEQARSTTSAIPTPDTTRGTAGPTPSGIAINLRTDPLMAENSPSRSTGAQTLPADYQEVLQTLLNPLMAENSPSRSTGAQTLPADFQAFLQTLLSQIAPAPSRGQSDNPATLAQLLEIVPGYSYSPGESIFIDIFVTLAQCLSFIDIVQLGLGISECLVRARPHLRQLISERLLNNEPLTIAAITQVVDRFNAELRPYFAIILDNARLREEVDLPASINFFNHSMLPTIINIIMEEGGNQASFHRNLMKKCAMYVRQLCAILQYCCMDGVTGLESILRAFVSQMITSGPGVMQELTMSHSIINFRSFISTLNVPVEDIKPFLVNRTSGPPTSPQPATSPPLVPPAAEPMEVQEIEEVEIESTPSLIREPPVGDVPPPQHINEVMGWQNALPSEWVPIISQDSQRQRRQSPQGPFSDAYLSGMPSKRRKLITSTKPQGNLSQVISESMATALGAAGMSSGPEVDVVAQRAGQDNTLRAAYREQVRTTLRHNLNSNPDYLPDKYPNTAKYLKK